jgi:hypothetical protein
MTHRQAKVLLKLLWHLEKTEIKTYCCAAAEEAPGAGATGTRRNLKINIIYTAAAPVLWWNRYLIKKGGATMLTYITLGLVAISFLVFVAQWVAYYRWHHK